MLGAKIHFHLMSMTFAALSSAVITREREREADSEITTSGFYLAKGKRN